MKLKKNQLKKNNAGICCRTIAPVLTSNEFSIVLYQLRPSTTKGDTPRHRSECKKLQQKLAKLIDNTREDV